MKIIRPALLPILTLFIALNASTNATAETQTPPAAPEAEMTAVPSTLAPTFRYHLIDEPKSLDPLSTRGINSRFVFFNLFRPLYRYDDSKGLVPEGAKDCKWLNPKRLDCTLNTKVKWSDGTVVTAGDYVSSFQRLFASDQKNEAAPLLFLRVKNAKKILDKKAEAKDLGVKAISESVLSFEFDENDSEFLYKLIDVATAPVKNKPDFSKASELLTNGPYKIKEWINGKKIVMEPNPNYPFGNPKRPLVEAIIVSDHLTALNLFESRNLNLLRQVPTTLLTEFEKRKHFFSVPIFRFNYVGFGPELQTQPLIRRALTYSLQFPEMQKIYHSKSPIGCPGIPTRLMDGKRPCYQFDQAKLKKNFDKWPENWKTRRFKFLFNQVGGDDFSVLAQWFQNQWKKTLEVSVDLETRESGVFQSTMRSNPPDIFHHTQFFERPTCLSALENFVKGSPDNWIQFDFSPYNTLVKKMASETNERSKRKLCAEGIKYLMDQNVLIPLGEPEVAMLHDGKFQGFKVNSMNQMDLSQLAVSTVSK